MKFIVIDFRCGRSDIKHYKMINPTMERLSQEGSILIIDVEEECYNLSKDQWIPIKEAGVK